MAPKKQGLGPALQALTNIAGFGLTVGAAILLGYYVGSYCDRKLGTEPWLMLVFVLLFIVGAFIKFFRTIQGVNGKGNDS